MLSSPFPAELLSQVVAARVHCFQNMSRPRIFRVGPGGLLDAGAVAKVAEALLGGGAIAVPTDTLYGVATVVDAVPRLYDLKRRDAGKPVAIVMGDLREVPQWAHTDHLPTNLLSSLLPGPVTVALPRRDTLSASLNPGVNLVGVRIVEGPIRQLCQAVGAPLALTSANISGEQSPLCIEDFKEMWPSLQAIVDGGEIPGGRQGSTVVALPEDGGGYQIIRAGCAQPETEQALQAAGMRPR